MSDDTQPPSPVPPPPSLGQTQPVPLKKETVRITLRAKPGEGGEGSVPAPSIPAPATAPLRPAAPPPPGMARPVAPPPPGMSGASVGSRTIPLSPSSPSAPSAPSLAKPLAATAQVRPMTAPSAPAQAAPGPRPTVRLQPQQPAGGISSTPLKPAMIADDDDEGSSEGGLTMLAGITTGLAAIFLAVAALGSEKFPLGVSLDQANAGWKIPRPAPLNSELKAKEDYARQDIAGEWSSDLELVEIPQFTAAP